MAKRGGRSRARTRKQRRGGGEPQRARTVKAEDAKTSAIGVGSAPTKGFSEVVILILYSRFEFAPFRSGPTRKPIRPHTNADPS